MRHECAYEYKETCQFCNPQNPYQEELESLNAELLEALKLCECELSLYVVLAEQSNNPQAWGDAIVSARRAIATATEDELTPS